MASMDDLIATISGNLHAGQKGNDLKELHAKLAQTLHPTKAPFRPIPPPSTALSPSAATGPLPPPAPASSWNEAFPSSAQNAQNAWGGMGNSPRQGAAMFAPQRETGFSIPPPKNNQSQSSDDQNRYNANVLPVQTSANETGGFENDAFKPLWDASEQKQKGFKEGK